MIRTMIKELNDLDLALETAQGEEREALLSQREALALRKDGITGDILCRVVLVAPQPQS